MANVFDIKRNDIKAAVDFYKKSKNKADDARVLLKLQDNPDKLLKKLAEIDGKGKKSKSKKKSKKK